jgi:hypothetical protein
VLAVLETPLSQSCGWQRSELFDQNVNMGNIPHLTDGFDQARALALGQGLKIAILKIHHGFQAFTGLKVDAVKCAGGSMSSVA